MSEDELQSAIWDALLEAMDKCQKVINLLEELDGGSHQLDAEWQELDEAFAHMHNVRRWIGRNWRKGPQPAAPVQVTQTMALDSGEMKKLLDQMRRAQQKG